MMTEAEVKSRATIVPPRRVENFWDEKHNELLVRLERDPLDDFLQWSLIQATMFVGRAPYTYSELQYVKQYTSWWPDRMKESHVGRPTTHTHLRTSGNAIHQAYHLARFLQETGTHLPQNARILEIGGGYGRLAQLFWDIGYRPDYTIYDLPAFSLLQEYYLSRVGVSVHCISQPSQANGRYDLIIGLWSLSEMDPAMRYVMLRRATADAYLFGLQHSWNELDNVDWFSDWIDTECFHRQWQLLPIEHLNAHYYLFGS